MEYISIDKKDLVELYGSCDNEIVDKMMSLMLEQTYPKITFFLMDHKEDSLALKVDFLIDFIPSFNMVGLSVISAKISLLNDKIKANTNPSILDESFSNLEKSLFRSETLIREYKSKMKKNI